jgi:scyllo-inositol 2-dehydrogenase (NADP+)
LDVQEDALKAGARPGDPGWGEEPQTSWGRLGDTAIPTKPGSYQYFYAAMASTIRDGSPVPVAPESAIATLEIIETAHKSAR